MERADNTCIILPKDNEPTDRKIKHKENARVGNAMENPRTTHEQRKGAEVERPGKYGNARRRHARNELENASTSIPGSWERGERLWKRG